MATEDHRSPHDATSPPLPPRAPRGLRRAGLAAVVAAVFIAVFGILERRGQDAEVRKWTQELAIPTVAVITPHAGASMQRMALPGTVQAWYEAPIYARVNGYLKDWHFDYGAHVKKGDVLAEIEDSRSRCAIGGGAGQAQLGEGGGEGQGSGTAARAIDL